MEEKRKRAKSKRNLWTPDQIDLLIEVWEDKLQDLRGARKNSHVFEEMLIVFEQHDHSVTIDEIKNRLRNMTARYKKEKTAIGPSGGSPSGWPYYDRIHRLLGSFKIHNVEDIIEDSIIDDDDTHEEWLQEEESFSNRTVGYDSEEANGSYSENLPSTSSSSGPERSTVKKRKVNSTQQELLNEFKKSNSCLEAELKRFRDTDEKLLKLEEERNDLLRDMATSTKELNEALIKFLSK